MTKDKKQIKKKKIKKKKNTQVSSKLRGSGLSLAELKKHLGSTRRPNNVVSNRGLRLDRMGLTDWRSYGVTHADVRGFHFPPGYVPDFMDWAPLTSDKDLVDNYFLNRGNIRRGGDTTYR